MLGENFYTYIYYDPLRNNIPIYVGKGSDVRVWKHLSAVKTNKRFQNRLKTLKRHNINPGIGIYAGLDEEFAHFLEEELIRKFGRKDLGKGSLYNLSNGGEGNSGWIPTEKQRKANSERHLGEKNGFYGKHHADETLETFSKIHTGQRAWNKGIPMSDHARKIQSERKSNIQKERVICPHCGTEGGKPIMARHHFNKCKQLKQINSIVGQEITHLGQNKAEAN